ncbi:ArsR/SmtB family transcription factor [Thermoanaerobacterium thermosaccharolyticum]|uniref:Transcriptional regulator, ArsR family n=1 Tax=Thermoanaerobacterium thermosaccharolyticum (strain ATCC 7956 / DSM 571 / NCIMB 9385 / NCA 3814 / NCTC 13789 / WDCM 00135 / 2032) TaxID=580327 RepID=D9TSX4_THETC|nr:transcriptional regulator, ArsR family [Thermoanaerobacterium thermosaccharolyticum DSM 571]TCW38087.1 ArsR family transcriptional regulator [Thermohydrogenium kirishiense]
MITMELYDKTAEYFKALSHPTRIKIIELLSKNEMCVCEMMAVLNLDQSHISRHLMVLRANGIVKDSREGTKIYYSLVDKAIVKIIDEVKNILTGK